MSIKNVINQDLKQAMLAGDKILVTTLRGLKSALLYAEVAKGLREQGLPDQQVIELLGKEAKKRQESVDLYTQGGSPERAEAELAEKKVIEKYLPAQLSEAAVRELVTDVIAEIGATDMTAMGSVMTAVKERTQGTADGALIANIVREALGA